jgi:putative DNA primase/helicase
MTKSNSHPFKDWARVPSALKEYRQWVCWKYQEIKTNSAGEYRQTKLPINPKTRQAAKTNAPHTWGNFSECIEAANTFGFEGIGFVLTDNDPFVAIDLDNCRDATTGSIEEWALQEVSQFDSYTEISPSGTGLHIIVKATMDDAGRKIKPREVYRSNRFITMTSQVHNDLHEIKECEDQLAKWLGNHFSQSNDNTSPALKEGLVQVISPNEALQIAFSAKNGEAIKRLWSGNTSGYSSESEADMALVRYLAFYVTDDYELENLLRQSALIRKKWGRPDYLKSTIRNVRQRLTATYKGSQTPLAAPNVEETITDAPSPVVEPATPPRLSTVDFTNVPSNTDLSRAVEFETMNVRHLRWCSASKQWLIWENGRWTFGGTRTADLLAQEYAASLCHKAGDCRDEEQRRILMQRACAASSGNAIREMLKMAAPRMAIQLADLDQKIEFLNCKNGTLNLRTHSLEPHNPQNLITKMVPVNYVPHATCPVFLDFLETIFNGNQDLIRFVQKAIGYTLAGTGEEEVFFVLHGTGQNGKTTLLETFSALLGDYSTSIQVETLYDRDRKAGSANSDIARLNGARFVYASEIREGKRLNEALIKKLTGRDKITARFLYKEEFEFYPQYTLFMASNYPPVIQDSSTAMKRRFRLIPFNVSIADDKRDTKLGEKLRGEFEGILSWAVEGYYLYRSEGLKPPHEIVEKSTQILDETDVIKCFINSCCILDSPAKETVAALYTAYTSWCAESGESPVTKKTFSQRMDLHGFPTENLKSRNKTAVKIGIRLQSRDTLDFGDTGVV